MILKTKIIVITMLISGIYLTGCNSGEVSETIVNPVIVSDTTPNDTDDPAIWYNRKDPGNSLILGTDKGDTSGGVFVFTLDGKLDTSLSLTNLKRPNNIDIEYGFNFNGKKTDIAAFTERGRDMIRIIKLPECVFIDNGGIPVFEDDSLRSPMGISLYKDKNEDIFAFVSRKEGPAEGYLYQYKLLSNDSVVKAKKVRALGKYSGKKEIEAIVVDDELGYVYYSDETIGIRQYYADEENGNQELALFAQTGIAGDQEGLSIYKKEGNKGFIIVSDQQANKFHLFSREGEKGDPYSHKLTRIVSAQTIESDGSDILNIPLSPSFPKGIFVAMSSDKTFQFYRAEDIVGKKSFLERFIITE
ncbi:MAG: phytase [Bacteroidales bacterium]|nr:phytase [Bacteroidales bacterium]